MRGRWLLALLALGCVRVKPPEPLPEPVAAPAPPPDVAPAPPAPAPEPARTGVYGLDEAVKDALSGPWTYVGTGGPWTGNQRLSACAYRNERVLVVDVYCSIKEVKAFRVDVFSPARGRVRLYAEARAPISSLTRRDYFSFTGESEPAPGPRAKLPPLDLTMSFPQLLDYDGRRYRRFLPSCYGGVENGRRLGGCLRELGPRSGTWAAANRAFLNAPPDDWYRLVRELRAQAALHGRDPP